MDIQELLRQLNINLSGEYNDNAYVIDIPDSDTYGVIYSKIDRSDIIEEYEANQVITEQGSSLMYTVPGTDYILNLIADFDGDRYQLIINEI